MPAFFISIFSLLLSFFPAPPDTPADPFVVISNIRIEGAKKTQPRLILRELDFAQGDSLPGAEAKDILLRNRNKIFNTNLFVTVDLSLQPGSGGQIDLLIRVTERWYVFPMLIFELADRNFNEWWVDRNRDLRRTQYGVRVAHKNFRGRGEVLRATAQFGFTKRFELGYNIRYLDRAQKSGLGFVVSYSDNRSVAYKTEYNKLVYSDFDGLARDRFYTGVSYSYRPHFYGTHRIDARFHYNTIADTIARLNPDYFLDYAALCGPFLPVHLGPARHCRIPPEGPFLSRGNQPVGAYPGRRRAPDHGRGLLLALPATGEKVLRVNGPARPDDHAGAPTLPQLPGYRLRV
jgi:hypothetical protein